VPVKTKPNFEAKRNKIVTKLAEHIGNQILEPVARDFDSVQDEWQGEDKSKFERRIIGSRNNQICQVVHTGPEAESASLTVWQLLEGGTSVRFMEVSEDWQSKTIPGSLATKGGQGETLGLGPTGWPGIEERGWIKIVADKWRKKAREAVVKAVREGMSAR
jgi:hypothetical protein